MVLSIEKQSLFETQYADLYKVYCLRNKGISARIPVVYDDMRQIYNILTYFITGKWNK